MKRILDELIAFVGLATILAVAIVKLLSPVERIYRKLKILAKRKKRKRNAKR